MNYIKILKENSAKRYSKNIYFTFDKNELTPVDPYSYNEAGMDAKIVKIERWNAGLLVYLDNYDVVMVTVKENSTDEVPYSVYKINGGLSGLTLKEAFVYGLKSEPPKDIGDGFYLIITFIENRGRPVVEFDFMQFFKNFIRSPRSPIKIQIKPYSTHNMSRHEMLANMAKGR